MGKIRQIHIKNRTYYFYNNQIDLKYFDANQKLTKKIIKTILAFITSVM